MVFNGVKYANRCASLEFVMSREGTDALTDTLLMLGTTKSVAGVISEGT